MWRFSIYHQLQYSLHSPRRQDFYHLHLPESTWCSRPLHWCVLWRLPLPVFSFEPRCQPHIWTSKWERFVWRNSGLCSLPLFYRQVLKKPQKQKRQQGKYCDRTMPDPAAPTSDHPAATCWTCAWPLPFSKVLKLDLDRMYKMETGGHIIINIIIQVVEIPYNLIHLIT